MPGHSRSELRRFEFRGLLPRNSRRRGSTFIEGAFIFLTLLLLILAILDLGQLLMFMQSFNERARAGARWATVNQYDPESIKNFVIYNSPSAPPGGGAGLFGLTPAMISVARYEQGSESDRIEVRITDFPLRLYTPFLARSLPTAQWRSVIAVESVGTAY